MRWPAIRVVLAGLATATLVAACTATDAGGSRGAETPKDAGSATTPFVLSDTFDGARTGSVPAGWSADTSDDGVVGVAAFPDRVDRSLRIAKTTPSGGTGAIARFAPLTGSVEVEARVWVGQTAGGVDVLTVTASDKRTVASVSVAGGQFVDAASGRHLRPAAAQRWYSLRALLETNNHRFDVFIDGQKVLADAPFQAPEPDIAGVVAGIEDGYTGTLYLDNVNADREPDPSVDYAVLDQFNDAPVGSRAPGYQVSGGDGEVRVVATPSDEDRSLLLAKTSPTGDTTAVREFTPLTGTVIAQANVRTDETAGTKVALYAQSSSGKTAAAIQFNNGWLVYYLRGVAQRLTPVVADEWYTLRLVIDLTAQQLDIYIDGRRFAPSDPAGGVASPWAVRDADTADLASLQFGVGAGQTGTLRVDNVMVYANPVAAPPGTVLDVRKAPYNAAGDGKTDDTGAIQRAINDVPAGGSVLLSGGVFVTGTIRLKSDMTLWVARDAVLLGTQNDAEYPMLSQRGTGTPDGEGVKKALIVSAGADNVNIDGGGTIDGNGAKPEWAIDGDGGTGIVRPTLIYLTKGHDVSIRNVFVRNAAAWAVVPAEVDGVLIADVDVDSNLYANRDGIDIVDSRNVLVERDSVWSDDDAICFKSYSQGVDGAVVRLSTVGHSERANGIKFGTESSGAFTNVRVEDVLVKNVNKAALTVTSVDGAAIAGITFRRITIGNALRTFFVLVGKRTGSARAPGMASGINFEDIAATGLTEPSLVSGERLNGTTYGLYDILVSNVHQVVAGGVLTVPGEPAEYTGEYPESNLFSSRNTEPPAYGGFFRYVNGLTVRNLATVVDSKDARPQVALSGTRDASVS